ncbi:MAG: hypothetical protein B7Y39_14045 [Bdellovibrio sp. 28-41-41]|nr:MAG: hypothetical protein B7Y39_14045 [Bdellovibrio sp. 28-41-41]
MFTEGIKKVFQRDYEKGVSEIANLFGFKSTTSTCHEFSNLSTIHSCQLIITQQNALIDNS